MVDGNLRCGFWYLLCVRFTRNLPLFLLRLVSVSLASCSHLIYACTASAVLALDVRTPSISFGLGFGFS